MNRFPIFAIAVLVPVAFAACGGTGAVPQDVLAGSDETTGADVAPDVTEDPDVPTVADAGKKDATPHDPGGPTDVSYPDLPFPVDLPGTCTGDADCASPCGKGNCNAGKCVYSAGAGYCVVPGDAGATCFLPGQGSPAQPCLVCNPDEFSNRLTPFLARAGFEGDDDWTPVVTDLSAGGIVWNVSDARAVAGTSALCFADPATSTYANGKHVASEATFPTVALPAGTSPVLAFRLFLDTEQTAGYDFVAVDAIAGDERTRIYTSDGLVGTSGGAFVPVTVDLAPWAGRTVTLAIVFDSIDAGMNGFLGACVDSVGVSTGCCSSFADCDDGDPCTDDACEGVGQGCVNTPRASCCASAGSCDDGDPCTADLCPVPGESCKFEPIADCCLADKDCDDGDSCTRDACPAAGGLCTHDPLCCAVDADCASVDPCLIGACKGTLCEYTDRCCHSDAVCDDGDGCTVDLCVSGDCVHKPAKIPGCCFPTVAEAAFDGGDDGFVLSPSTSGVGWSVVVGGQSDSAPGALYYGNPSTKEFYADSGSTSGTATSAAFDIPADYDSKVSFRVYLAADAYGDGWGENDVEAVLVVEDAEYPLWEFGYSDPEKSWFTVEADVSAFGGRTAQIRFKCSNEWVSWDDPWWSPPMSPLPLSANGSSEGLYIDSIAVATSCALKTCASKSDCPSLDSCVSGSCPDGVCVWVDSCCEDDAECDDGEVCTTDTCASKKCVFQTISACCKTPADCDDKNACTLDVCPMFGGTCENPAIEGCCLSAAGCDDGDACTIDRCTDHVCAHEDICCTSDAECDDGDDVCTLDSCVASFCVHEQTGVEGCCAPAVLTASFEGGDAAGFTMDPAVGGVGWTVADGGEAADGTGALYYGKPSVWNFDNDQINGGSARSPAITIPAGYAAKLAFTVYMDTETGLGYDRLKLTWTDDSGERILWSKSKLNDFKKKVPVVLDVSVLNGRTGFLTFSFDTVDDTVNLGKGVFIDALTITSTCASVSCAAAVQCSDGLPLSTELCIGGGCVWNLVADWGADCLTNSECDDDDYCTDDSCVKGACEFVDEGWCW